MAFIARKLETDGPVTRFGLLGMNIVLVAEPAAVQQVLKGNARAYGKGPILGNIGEVFGRGLLTAEGEEWRQRRKATQPLFHSSRVLGEYATIVRQAAVTRFSAWREGQVIAVQREMTALALEIVVRALFGAEAEPYREEIGRAFREVTDFFEYTLTPRGHFLKRAPLPRRRAYLQAVASLDSILSRIAIGSDLPLERDELMTLFIAGHETTAAALTFAIYLAAQHPASQLAAAREGLIAETLRLYPPVWSVGREALEDDRLAGQDVHKGDLVLVPIWRIHRDSRFYPRPDAFDPSRWDDGQAAAIKGAYLPFGDGPRVCIGAGFARMEMDIALEELFSRFRIEPAGGPEWSGPLDLVGTLTARSRLEIQARLVAT
jgi:cytochrome P450